MRKYGEWAGNPKGKLENKKNCIVEVQGLGRGLFFYQCERKRGHGENGLYCKQHAKMLDSGRFLFIPKDDGK